MTLAERVCKFLGKRVVIDSYIGVIGDLLDVGERLQEANSNAHERVKALEKEYKLYENYLLGRLQKAESSEYVAMLQDDNKRLCREVCRLRQKTSFKVYEENLLLVEENARLKGERQNECQLSKMP